MRILEAELLPSLIVVGFLGHFIDELIELDTLRVLVVEVSRDIAPSASLITIQTSLSFNDSYSLMITCSFTSYER